METGTFVHTAVVCFSSFLFVFVFLSLDLFLVLTLLEEVLTLLQVFFFIVRMEISLLF